MDKINSVFEAILNNSKSVNRPLNYSIYNFNDCLNEIIERIPKNISDTELYAFLSDFCASKISYHPEYNRIASHISMKQLHEKTSNKILDVGTELFKNDIISQEMFELYKTYHEYIDSIIDYNKDYDFDYFGMKTMEKIYLLKAKNKIIERPQHLFIRVAFGIHKNDLKLATETYINMSDRYFTHATPTLFNIGTKHEQLSSCFLIGCEDNLESIMDTQSEMAQISKYAGGIGLHLSSIRGKGSHIKGTNGKTDGIIPLCVYTCKLARYINQGGKRNGSINCFLEPWHCDVYEFCELRIPNTGNDDNRARDLFISLWICDLFMQRVKNDEMWSLMCPNECPNLNTTHGKEFEELYENYEKEKRFKKQVKARDLFDHILTCQLSSGMPFMCYKDHANNKSNQKNLGTIRSSNLCVHEDTQILTKQGYKNIKSMKDKEVEAWNGEEWSKVIVRQTGSGCDLIRVNLSNGAYLDCTQEHKFYIQKGFAGSPITEVQAKDLTKDNRLIKMILPEAIEFENDNFKYPYTHGFFCGDGTTFNSTKTKDIPILSLYGEKIKLLDHFNYTSQGKVLKGKNVDKLTITLPKDMEKKFTVPLNYNINIRLRWFEGMCDSDGSIAKNGTNESIQICSINKQFLTEIRYMLHTLGVESKITLSRNEQQRLLPDGKGGEKLYDCKNIFRLLVSSSGLYKLHELGFSPKRLCFEPREPNRNAEQFVKVVSVEPSFQNVDTYCFTEPKKHMGVFNGILTGQCVEIIEYSDKNETAVCNLASICLPRFIKNKVYDYEKLGEITRMSVRNLNKIIDINYYHHDKSRGSNYKNRPVGLGVQGLADVYNLLETSFESDKAQQINKKIFETIYYYAVDESMRIAQKEGHYESFPNSPFSEGKLQYHLWGLNEDNLETKDTLDWKGLTENVKKYGTRNSLLTALMPTASTSQLMGCSECFEPYMSNIFTRSTLAGEYIVINSNLVKTLEELELWDVNMRNEILNNKGSIQNIGSIPKYVKAIYKTAFEIKLKSIIEQSAARGPFIDQSQSLNLFLDEQNRTKLRSALLYGWEQGLKTGMYYLRTTSAVDPLKVGLEVKSAKKGVCRWSKGKKPEDCLVCSA